VQTSARRQGDVYLVNGQKVWTSFGHYADWCLLLTRTSAGASRHRGLTMFVMPMHQPGVQPRRIRQISEDSEFNEVFYDQAEVSADCRIGAEGEGWQVAMTILTAERGVGFAALALNKHTGLLDLLDHCARNDPAARGEAARLRDRLRQVLAEYLRHYNAAGRTVPLASSHQLKLTAIHRRSTPPSTDPPKTGPWRTHARVPDRGLAAPPSCEKEQVTATIVYSSPAGCVQVSARSRRRACSGRGPCATRWSSRPAVRGARPCACRESRPWL